MLLACINSGVEHEANALFSCRMVLKGNKNAELTELLGFEISVVGD